MPPVPTHCLLDLTLNAVARRYRVPAVFTAPLPTTEATPATALATAIERAREATARGEVPGAETKACFIDALARLIREAMRAESGDPAFQAMLLRHRTAVVREYASLSAHAARDRRVIHAAVNAIAHPARQQSDTLAQLRALASAEAWSALHDAVQQAVASTNTACLAQLLDNPALHRLRRLEALSSDERVRRYRSLWERQGVRRGSSSAVAQGLVSRQRGDAVEASASEALEALARRLDATEHETASYCVVNSMRVPASIPASHERAKTEWDAVLLRRPKAAGEAAPWDVCLLVEAKASADAATTDFQRLLRGLNLLAHADSSVVYSFQTREGPVNLNGASLRALRTDAAGLATTVLYCCAAPAEAMPRLLNPASRMQLLSADASLRFASALADNQHGDSRDLEPVWDELLESPKWRAVLNQYPMLCQVRELMVHVDDFRAAVGGASEAGGD
ncbi:MAG TPA: 3-deoxy-D-arabino-heptulosonate 7-phosphate synthase [Paraburkholderia sp.]|jgi:hypothetical protein|nr:3-deoxy-D-arabino-heptulosonate 7-phosphate synthase [Paraburkholderia sp.]